MIRARRLAAGLLVALALLGSLAAADITRDRRAAASLLTKVTPSAEARFQPGGPERPTFVLLIGSDEREGLEGERADALHLVGLNPATGQATILNFPRDTWVPIPGRRSMRINEAFNEGGGPELQAATVTELTGVPIDYVLTTTFVGLQAMVDDLGGIEVDVPEAMDDRISGAVLPAGRVVLGGPQALAFSRNRNLGGGDFTRTTNQGRLIVHALESLRARGTSGTDVVGYLDALLRNVRTEGAGPADLYHLGRAALAVDPGAVRNYTVPAREGTVGPAAVVFLEPGAAAVFADFADDAVLQGH